MLLFFLSSEIIQTKRSKSVPSSFSLFLLLNWASRNNTNINLYWLKKDQDKWLFLAQLGQTTGKNLYTTSHACSNNSQTYRRVKFFRNKAAITRPGIWYLIGNYRERCITALEQIPKMSPLLCLFKTPPPHLILDHLWIRK